MRSLIGTIAAVFLLVAVPTTLRKVSADCGPYPKEFEGIKCPDGSTATFVCRDDGNWVLTCPRQT